MAAFCLLPKYVDQFKKGLIEGVKNDGELRPDKLSSLSSADRRSLLEKYVGKDNAQQVNALFESKLLLKNQKAGYISWAKKVTGISTPAKRDLISQIERLQTVLDPKAEQQFLNDLASTRLKVNVTQEEAKNIADLSKKVQELKTNMGSDFTFKTKSERLAYGRATVNLSNYVNDLKGLNKFNIKSLTDIAGVSKSIRASMDNSAIFRQGWKTLFTNPISWQINARATFSDMVKTLGGKNVMDEIMADRMSRPNELNGNYNKMGLSVSKPEEAFPTTLPEKIPIVGRFYKASEVAYTGFVYKQRMDIADTYIKIAQKSGVDLTPKELKSIGSMVNSLTGRGNLGKYEPAANLVNNVFFSPRYIKSQIDTVGHILTGAGGSNFVRKQAAINLVKVVMGTAAVLVTANALKPGSVEWDSRSSDFGKIRVGNTRFDVTGGASSIITLASRLATLSSKSSTTGIISPINSGKFGSQTGKDVVLDFITNKLSPAAQVVVDLLNQKDFNNKPITPLGEVKNLYEPLIGSTYEELKKDPNSAPILLAMIADGLGIATNTYGKSQKDWTTNPTKEQASFKQKVGDTKFKEANNKFNLQYDSWSNKIQRSTSYKNLSSDSKAALNTKAKTVIQAKVFKSYGFKYKIQRKPKTETNKIKSLLP